MLYIKDVNLYKKKVLIRSDLNVPIKNGKIISDKRIKLSIPTIEYVLNKGSNIIIMSHLGRPYSGKFDKNYSLFPIVKYLENYFNISISLFKDYLNCKNLFTNINSKIIVLENVRFNIGEVENNIDLSKKYASFCDVFVMDAFGAAHRKHSSTYGVAKFAPVSCSGLLFHSEIKILNSVMLNPKKPMVAIVGGAKISTKFNVLSKLSKICDNLIVGGGISNTFISINNNVGKSLYEPNYINIAKKLILNKNIFIPLDCRVKKNKLNGFKSYVKKITNIYNNEEIMDFGDKTIKLVLDIINKSNTILWNGPVGAFEIDEFSIGTKLISKAICNSKAFSVIGGGDTILAIEKFGNLEKISYVSTGGGSFLKFIEKRDFPIISLLKKKY